jgi:beta-aspartyl-dipeptidase (metallo-type)
LKRLAADIRVGAILAGKAGVMNLHVGDGDRGLDLLREIVATTEIPYSQFLPTHVNRSEHLFQEGIAYALAGGFIDLTAAPDRAGADELKACTGLRRCLERGVPAERITFSSDGQGSLPIFNEHKELIRLGVGQVASLFREVRDAIREEGVPLESALRTITQNPAELYKLKGKGRVRTGFDADLVLVDPDTMEIDTVLAKGRILMLHGQVQVSGTFE